MAIGLNIRLVRLNTYASKLLFQARSNSFIIKSCRG